jgi:hypothetical protein
MNNQKLLLSIIGIIAIFGIGYLIVSSNRVNEPIISENPEDVGGETIIDPINGQPSNIKAFGKEVKMAEKETVTFSDGLVVSLFDINDSRCKEGLQCIWQGELSGTFRVSSGKMSGEREVILGTERNGVVKINDYTFTLKDATPISITYIVTYQKTLTGGPCYVGGCSGHICSDEKDVASTCEYKEEYACYKTAKCERQTSGQCGWTQTPTLQACLSAN